MTGSHGMSRGTLWHEPWGPNVVSRSPFRSASWGAPRQQAVPWGRKRRVCGSQQPCAVGCAGSLFARAPQLAPPWRCPAPSWHLSSSSSAGWAPALPLPMALQVRGAHGPQWGREAAVPHGWMLLPGDGGQGHDVGLRGLTRR